jgi:hypothetical protein
MHLQPNPNAYAFHRNGSKATNELRRLIEDTASRLNQFNPTDAPARSDLIAG